MSWSRGVCWRRSLKRVSWPKYSHSYTNRWISDHTNQRLSEIAAKIRLPVINQYLPRSKASPILPYAGLNVSAISSKAWFTWVDTIQCLSLINCGCDWRLRADFRMHVRWHQSLRSLQNSPVIFHWCSWLRVHFLIFSSLRVEMSVLSRWLRN